MGLTPTEDGDLRRLAAFDRIGFLDDFGKAQLLRLRERDRRESVREVTDVVEHLPSVRQLATRPAAYCSLYPR
jgi:hypothetical protein